MVYQLTALLTLIYAIFKLVTGSYYSAAGLVISAYFQLRKTLWIILLPVLLFCFEFAGNSTQSVTSVKGYEEATKAMATHTFNIFLAQNNYLYYGDGTLQHQLGKVIFECYSEPIAEGSKVLVKSITATVAEPVTGIAADVVAGQLIQIARESSCVVAYRHMLETVVFYDGSEINLGYEMCTRTSMKSLSDCIYRIDEFFVRYDKWVEVNL